jgi:hypothetical protein
MISTEVVDTTQHIHASLEGFGLAGQGTGATGQRYQALAEGGVKPLNESGINDPYPLADLDKPLNHLLATLSDASINGQSTGRSGFDHLHDSHLGPSIQTRATGSASTGYFRAKSPLKGPDIAGQAINRQQQGTTQGHRSNFIGQSLDQLLISPGADHPTQPQPARDHDRHCQPKGTRLGFDLDFIRLHLAQIKLALTHHLLVDFLTMDPCSSPPTFDRPFVKSIGRHYRLDRTPVHQQSDHDHHHLGIRFQSIKDRPFRHRKGLLTNLTAISFLFQTMALYISSIDLASCRTLNIRAKYCLWVHRLHSWFWFRNLPVCLMNPFFSNFSFLSAHHALVWCYLRFITGVLFVFPARTPYTALLQIQF